MPLPAVHLFEAVADETADWDIEKVHARYVPEHKAMIYAYPTGPDEMTALIYHLDIQKWSTRIKTKSIDQLLLDWPK